MKSNYHTHNYRCNHATGEVVDYVKEAIKNGFDEIGISDHLPHPGKNIDNNYRMKYEDLINYFNDIDLSISELGEKISIKKGVECEYFDDFDWLYLELLNKYKVDYLILGVHFYIHNGKWEYVGNINNDKDKFKSYIEYTIKSMKSGIFKYMAHPDLFGMGYRDWDELSIEASRKIFKIAEEMNIVLEINVNGLRKPKIVYNNGMRYPYPIKDFWEMAKDYNVQIIIGIDAHAPNELKDYNMGLDFANELGINVIDRLKF